MSKERNPDSRVLYTLTAEQLTWPKAGGEIGLLWLDSIIGFQLEGVENRVRPQNLKEVPETYLEKWISAVWRTYRNVSGSEDRHEAALSEIAGTVSLRLGRR